MAIDTKISEHLEFKLLKAAVKVANEQRKYKNQPQVVELVEYDALLQGIELHVWTQMLYRKEQDSDSAYIGQCKLAETAVLSDTIYIIAGSYIQTPQHP